MFADLAHCNVGSTESNQEFHYTSTVSTIKKSSLPKTTFLLYSRYTVDTNIMVISEEIHLQYVKQVYYYLTAWWCKGVKILYHMPAYVIITRNKQIGHNSLAFCAGVKGCGHIKALGWGIEQTIKCK